MKDIIVVEGRDDTRRLKEYFPTIETIETNGSAINEETLALIAKAAAYRGVIVLTVPDFPGEKIRKTITQAVPTVKHAFLTVEEALPKHKGSLGVEHASKAAIERALSRVQTGLDYTEQTQHINQTFLVRLSLVGAANSGHYRQALAEVLGIGHVNGKQLEKRLNMFGITQEQVLSAFATILEKDRITNG